MKLEWRMGLCPEQTPLTFGMDPDQGTDPGISLTLYEIGHSTLFSLISQGIIHASLKKLVN